MRLKFLWRKLGFFLRLTGFRVGAARAIVFNGQKVLLVRHRGSTVWCLPGGGFSRREDPSDAVQRELLEELKLPIVIKNKLGVYIFSNPTLDTHTHVFIASTKHKIGKFSLEISEAGWFLPDELPRNTTQGTRRRLQEALGQKPVTPTW